MLSVLWIFTIINISAFAKPFTHYLLPTRARKLLNNANFYLFIMLSKGNLNKMLLLEIKFTTICLFLHSYN